MDERFSSTALVLARESRRLTQGDLSAAAGVAQGTISKLENGLLQPERDLVGRLAAALRYPEEFFLSDIREADLPAVFYRKKKSLVRVGDEKAIRANVNILRRSIARLLKSVDVPQNRIPLVELERRELTPAQVARDLRAQWGLPRGPIDDVTSVLERAGVVVVPFEFGVRTIDAMSLHRIDDGIPPMIFVNPWCPGDRMRFTLAHELAHLLFHHHLSIPPDDVESEADEFAAEFVAPAADIRPHLVNVTFERLAGLKRHWKLSMLCLLKRAEDTGRISEWKARRLWMQASKMGYRTAEPIAIAPEQPTMLRRVLRVHMEELGYSEEELARVIQGDPQTLRTPHGLRAV